MDIDANKVVESLRACATESFEACRDRCHYNGKCTKLLDDATALLAAGYDLSEEKQNDKRTNSETGSSPV